MKVVKWISAVAAGLIVIVLAALLLIPMFVDMGKYRPMIERRVSDSLGLPFSIKGDIKLSLFPWAGVAIKDLRLGNPPGFEGDSLLSIKSLDVQVKLIPLFSRDLEVKKFQLEGPRIVLEKNKDGRANWAAIGKAGGEVSPPPAKEKTPQTGGGTADEFPIRSLALGEMTVRGGSLLWVDRAQGTKKEINDIGLEIKGASLDRPVDFLLRAAVDGNALQVQGNLGPLGHDPMKGSVPLAITLKGFKELSMALKGKVQDVGTHPKFDLAMDVSPFSPRKLLSALGREFPLTTSDPKALSMTSLKCVLKGGAAGVAVSDGVMNLDQSIFRFTADAKDFSKPVLSFKVSLDQMDLDRYLPPPQEKKGSEKSPGEARPVEGKKSDYSSFRKAVVDGEIRAGKMKIKGAEIQDVTAKVQARDGVLRLDPFSFSAYEGTLRSKAEVDLRTDRPRTSVEMESAGLKVRPLLNALLKKDFLEGTAEARLDLRMEGDAADAIKKSLNGGGNLRIKDGAIVGIDLSAMARNVESAFGTAEKPAERAKTDFSEMNVPYSIKDGVVQIQKASLASPLLRAEATGRADLDKETLDIHVEPKFVATLKGQGDTKERSGFGVPVLVTGTFSSPRFAPDLQGLLKKGLPSPSDLEGLLKGKDSKQQGAPKPEDTLKGILRQFTR